MEKHHLFLLIGAFSGGTVSLDDLMGYYGTTLYLKGGGRGLFSNNFDVITSEPWNGAATMWGESRCLTSPGIADYAGGDVHSMR